jgi:D-inositol-3-phosphate glycosyltransferase
VHTGRKPARIATISLHTSPLDQPGTGDAGGLNVYVVETAKRLAERNIEVEIFTRAVSQDIPPQVELVPGVLVRNVVAGPFEELDKNSLPAQICPFTFGVLRTEVAFAPGRYDLVHAHYWLSGQVGAVAAARWSVPLVQSMHTLGKVKNLALASGDPAEPDARIRGEHEVVAAAGRLVANTAEESSQLIDLYGATPEQVRTVNPGVDLSLFRPGSQQAVRQRLGLPPDAVVLLFAGRVQPLKGPDVVLRAAAELAQRNPELASRLVVVFVGGPSGSEVGAPGRLAPSPPGWASRTGSGWSRRARNASWPTGTGRRHWCSCRRTRSRSAWWPSRHRRVERRWSPPPSADCGPRSATGSPACSSTGTTRRTGALLFQHCFMILEFWPTYRWGP